MAAGSLVSVEIAVKTYYTKKKKLFRFIFIGNRVFERVVKFHTRVKNRVSFYVLTDWAYFRVFFVFCFWFYPFTREYLLLQS